jgi:hypothetical protein
MEFQNKQLFFKMAILNLSVLFCTFSFAESEVRSTRISSEMRAIKNTSSFGILFGSRYLSFESENFAVGGAGYSGQLSGGSVGSFSYGGLVVNYSTNLNKKTEFEFNLLGGGAGGFNSTLTGGGVILEPSISLGFDLGKTVRMGINTGYAWVPSLNAFSGITFGLRCDFILYSTGSL